MNHRTADESDDLQLVSVDRLREFCDPFSSPPWEGVVSLTIDAVKQAIADRCFEKSSFSAHIARNAYHATHGWDDGPEVWPVETHIARIAYLATYGWDDAIHLDVGIPSIGAWVTWMVRDGNHRLAAAIVRDDPFIRASFSGSCEQMIALFGETMDETSEAT